MSLALYRKYRPATFAEVKGQDHATVPLMQALAADRVNHAYLFSGPRGCGKTSSARILARSLNCATGVTPDPCGVCDSCVALAPNGPGRLDVIEIDAASHGGVDDARDLRDGANYAPVADRFKVYIIDEAHMVTPQGFNALLKLVEEPPPFVKFIFATTEPEKVLTTIRSRTHHYAFRLVPPAVLRELLTEVCQREQVTVDPLVLPLVVRAGAGSVRDSLSVLDQLLSGVGPEGLTYSHALAQLGMTAPVLLDEVVDALAAGDAATIFLTIERLVEAGHDVRRFATDLLDRLRDLVLLDAVPAAAESGLVVAPAEEVERMRTQAAGVGTAGLARAASLLADGLTEMRGATAPRLVLELVVARILLTAGDRTVEGVATRVEHLERRLMLSPPSADTPGPAAPAAARPAVQRPAPQRHTAPQPAAPQPAAAQVAAPSAPSEPPAGHRHPDPAVEHPPGPTSSERAPAPSSPVRPEATAPASPASASSSGSAPSAPAAAAHTDAGDPAAAPAASAADDDWPETVLPGTAPTAPPAPPVSQSEPGPVADEQAVPPAAVGPDDGSAARPDEAPAARQEAAPAAAPTPEVAAPQSAPESESAPEPAPESEPAPSAAAAPVTPSGRPAGTAPGTVDAAGLRRVWPEVLDRVKDIKRTPYAMLSDAQVVSVDGPRVQLGFPHAGLSRRFSEPAYVGVLVQALTDVLGGTWQIECAVLGESAPAPSAATPSAAPTATGAPTEEQPAEPAGPSFEGFAEGDEPADEDPDDPTPHQQPEDVALALLQEGLGARPLE